MEGGEDGEGGGNGSGKNGAASSRIVLKEPKPRRANESTIAGG